MFLICAAGVPINVSLVCNTTRGARYSHGRIRQLGGKGSRGNESRKIEVNIIEFIQISHKNNGTDSRLSLTKMTDKEKSTLLCLITELLSVFSF